MFTEKDLIYTGVDNPDGLPLPFVGMLLRSQDGMSDECIVTKVPSFKTASCITHVDYVAIGGQFPNIFHLGCYSTKVWGLPFLDFVPGKKLIEEWEGALIELCKIPGSPQNVLKLGNIVWGGYGFQNGIWKSIDKYEKGMTFPAPIKYADTIFSPCRGNITSGSTLTLKQQNTDGRNNCAKCGGPIKKLPGFSVVYNHCPVCEG